jgi:hypothetical protein
MRITRVEVKLNRMWKRKSLREVNHISKTNGKDRARLYAKMDRAYDKMRVGLKELIRDTMRLRRPIQQTAPDCPKQRWI